VAGALKIYWEQVPKIYTKFGSILIAEPLENVFSKNNFSKNQKLVIFLYFFFRGELLGQRLRRGVVIRWKYWWYIFGNIGGIFSS
jgi:hypothetical protein